MLRLVYGYVVPIVLLLVVGIVGYNYFLGTEEEQQSSRQIISQVKGLGSNIVSLLSSEKEKFDRGKYNDALSKIGAAVTAVKEQAATLADDGQAWLDRLNELEQRQQQLQAELNAMPESRSSESGTATPETVRLQAEIENLANQTELLGTEISQQ